MKLVIEDNIINTKHIVEVSTTSGLSSGGQINLKLDNGSLVRTSLSSEIEFKIAKMFILYGYKLGNDTLFFGRRDMALFMRAVLDMYEADTNKYCAQVCYDYANSKDLTYEELCRLIDSAVQAALKENEDMKWHEAFYKVFALGKRDRFRGYYGEV